MEAFRQLGSSRKLLAYDWAKGGRDFDSDFAESNEVLSLKLSTLKSGVSRRLRHNTLNIEHR